jgi:hypothetical protein
MKTDRFTRIVLTVIAVNLTFLSFQHLDIIPKANAEGVNPPNGLLPANINYGLVPLNKEGGIDVTIKSIGQGTELDINIEEVGGSHVFGKLPVEIKDQPVRVKGE